MPLLPEPTEESVKRSASGAVAGAAVAAVVGAAGEVEPTPASSSERRDAVRPSVEPMEDDDDDVAASSAFTPSSVTRTEPAIVESAYEPAGPHRVDDARRGVPRSVAPGTARGASWIPTP